MIALYNSTNGDGWNNKTGWKLAPLETDGFGAYGSEGSWYGVTVQNGTVTTLTLESNNLSGPLPSSMGDLSNLQSLQFYGNPLITGPLPNSMANLSKLQMVHLSNSQLNGPLPAWLESLPLTNLVLYNNRFTGPIPAEIGNLTNIFELGLSSNMLTGEIPATFSNMTHLGSLNLAYNGLYTCNSELKDFLDNKQAGWDTTQTIAPANVVATVVNSTTINLTWDAITYTSNTGGYRILVGTAPGGPYTFFQQTADKSTISLPVTGLNPGTPYYFVIQTRTNANDNNPNIVDSEYSSEVTATTIVEETVSAPTTPTGPVSGSISTSYDYSTNGATSSLGHSIQYNFDWDDGSDSGWLAVGTTEASHSWAAAGTYDVRAMARCAEHTAVESLWSATLAVVITGGSVAGNYNSPAQYKVLPEVIWASATGGGTWMSACR